METRCVTATIIAACLALVQVPNSVRAHEVPENCCDPVSKGLDYLIKKQCPDGRWEGEDGRHPVAMTGLVGIALVMKWQKEPGWREVKRADTIRKAVDWLMDQSQAARGGLIYSGHPSETARYMEGHALATMFLIEAHYFVESEKRTRLDDIRQRALQYIVKAQSSQGGWYHTSRAEGHDLGVMIPTALQIRALLTANAHGLSVSETVLTNAQEYLRASLARAEEVPHCGLNAERPMDTVAALACQFGLRSYHEARDPPLGFGRLALERGPVNVGEPTSMRLKRCRGEIPMAGNLQWGRDEVTHYYYAHALHLACHNFPDYYGQAWRLASHGSPDDLAVWKDYQRAMFDHLRRSQNKDGSWPHGDFKMRDEKSEPFAIGPICATAVWCTILQLHKEGHHSVQGATSRFGVGVGFPSTLR